MHGMQKSKWFNLSKYFWPFWFSDKYLALPVYVDDLQEQLEHKKAEYAEKIKNKVALIHKEANEKRAMVDARRGKEILKAEEMAAKYRATGQTPKKFLGCFWC